MKKLFEHCWAWIWTLLHHRETIDDLSTALGEMRKKYDFVLTKVRAMEREFEPAMADTEWAERVARYAGRIQRGVYLRDGVEVGQRHGLASELIALLERVSLSLKAGDLNTVHVWLSGPKRPDTHTQRHNDVLTTIEEMRRQQEMTDNQARQLSEEILKIYLIKTKGYVPGDAPDIVVDVQSTIVNPQPAVHVKKTPDKPKKRTSAKRESKKQQGK